MEREKILKHYLNEAEQLILWPSKPAKRLVVLEYLSQKFERGKEYSEIEVNFILKKWHIFQDHALLRRELFEKGFMDRTLDGRAYWRRK